jgi:hypothetical protein
MKVNKVIAKTMVRRALKSTPVISTGVVAFLALGTIRKKGFFKGSADVLLDITPVVGLTKNVVEAFTGDLIPDKRV